MSHYGRVLAVKAYFVPGSQWKLVDCLSAWAQHTATARAEQQVQMQSCTGGNSEEQISRGTRTPKSPKFLLKNIKTAGTTACCQKLQGKRKHTIYQIAGKDFAAAKLGYEGQRGKKRQGKSLLGLN